MGLALSPPVNVSTRFRNTASRSGSKGAAPAFGIQIAPGTER